MSSVVVVIPVYKALPSESESTSMIQTLKMLHKYPVMLVGPEKLNYSNYTSLGFSEDMIKTFPAKHFEGIQAYNKMLCSAWFYKAFEEFDYMFICQNDAWVFRDELEMWCEKGYDYIGSPWIWKPEQVKKKVFIDLFPLLEGEVGNGGVSLRKIKKHLELNKLAGALYFVFKKNEDFIWLLVSKLPFIKMKKPGVTEALEFCIEMEPEEAMKMIGGKLPFTVHAYERYGGEYWRMYME